VDKGTEEPDKKNDRSDEFNSYEFAVKKKTMQIEMPLPRSANRVTRHVLAPNLKSDWQGSRCNALSLVSGGEKGA
jgi:hypothetical protein